MSGAGRIEDRRLVTGAGRYVADRISAGALRAAFARADRAGARVLGVDTAAAAAMPGVVAVLTAADLAGHGVGPLPAGTLPQDAGGSFDRPVPLLADARLRHVGEPVAMVVATSADAARDAAEAVVVESVDDPEPEETCFVREIGDRAGVAAALAASAHRVTVTLSVPRLQAVTLEPRGCLATPEAHGRLDLLTTTQSPAQLVAPLAAVLGLEPSKVRVHAGDVGGSFGLKGSLVREEALVAHAALRLGRPVAWIQSRTEAFTADHQGRGVSGTVTLGLDEDLRFTALEGRFTADAGAYPTVRSLGLVNNIGGFAGVYDIPVAHATVTGRTSPRAGIAPYRGHGRPEATLAIEAAIDEAARRLGADPLDLRRRNLIPREALPRRNALGFPLDSGDFAGVLERCATLSRAADAPARRADAAARGRLFGRALVLSVETAGGPLRGPRPDHVTLSVDPHGRVVLAPGVMSTGQGHETTLTRMVAAGLGVAEERIAYVHGDSAVQPEGRGNGGSSGLAVTGPAVAAAIDRLAAEAREVAATHFGTRPERIEREGDLYRLAGSNNAITLAEVARLGGGFAVLESFTPPSATFPNGAHACEVEVDPETGVVEVTAYAAVEDVGTVLSPALVEGQMHGGILQGVAQVLGERKIIDADGQVLTGSLMDYRVGRADDMPAPRLETHPVPTAVNPLGVKGVGEAGTVGALAAAWCAVVDALAPLGPVDLEMPATPAAVWRAIARAGSTAG